MSIQNVSAKDLKRASKIKDQMDQLEAEFSSILKRAGAAVSSTNSKPKRKKRKMSKAAKAKIAAAQRKRWRSQKSAEKNQVAEK